MKIWLTVGLFVSAFAHALPTTPPLHLMGLSIEVDGWKIAQQARSRETRILRLERAGQSLLFLVDPESEDFSPAAFRGEDPSWLRTHNGLDWKLRLVRAREGALRSVVFATRLGGLTYGGYVSGESEADLTDLVELFLNGVKPYDARSLTTDFFYGKKYYLGFGDYLSGSMGNEVKYDIAHTHDIFTKEIGGNYVGTKVLDSGQGARQVRDYWKDLEQNMLWNDMYVQYSAGHGHQTGLAFGVSYNEIRDALLALPAREIVVFIMACHSGGLVNAFNNKKYLWENWGQYNRTLFVMASSKVSELSSTGPGTDNEEPGGPNGSAGSAFGHALWKALIGHSDGYQTRVRDGLISLGELIDFTVWRTKSGWGHTPVYTGIYDRELLVNRVPTAEELRQFTGGTEGLSDETITERIRDLDLSLSAN